MDPRAIINEVDRRFWERTQYKPNRRLDMRDASDRVMATIWIDTLNQLLLETDPVHQARIGCSLWGNRFGWAFTYVPPYGWY